MFELEPSRNEQRGCSQWVRKDVQSVGLRRHWTLSAGISLVKMGFSAGVRNVVWRNEENTDRLKKGENIIKGAVKSISRRKRVKRPVGDTATNDVGFTQKKQKLTMRSKGP